MKYTGHIKTFLQIIFFSTVSYQQPQVSHGFLVGLLIKTATAGQCFKSTNLTQNHKQHSQDVVKKEPKAKRSNVRTPNGLPKSPKPHSQFK